MNDPKKSTKNTRKKLLVGGVAIAAALAVGSAAYARHRGPGGPGFGGFGFHRILWTLDLTEEQEISAVRLMRQTREERQALREGHAARMATLKAELAAETPNAERLHEMLDEMARERTQLGHSAIDRFLELHATLSGDQRNELVEKLEKLEQRRRRWHEE